jgi:protein SCO1/2
MAARAEERSGSIQAGAARWRRWLVVAAAGVALAWVGLALIGPAGAAPPVALTDQSGRPAGLDDLRGRPVVLTFLYTHCPDVCPLTLANIAAASRAVAATGGERPAVVVVTVDPDRDTIERLRAYAGGWPADWRFLTGDYRQLAPIWRAYGVAVEKRPLPHSSEVHTGYAIVHTNKTVLVDREGRLSGELVGAWTATDLASALRGATGGAPAAWQHARLAGGLDAFLRACGEFAAAQPGLAAGLLAALLLPGLLLPVWLIRALLGGRRQTAGRAWGRHGQP